MCRTSSGRGLAEVGRMAAELGRRARAADWAALGWLFLYFWYFSGVTHLLIKLGDAAGFSGLRQSLTMSLLWLVPLLLWPQRTRGIAALLGILLWLCSLPAFGYYLVYGQEFSQSVIFILFESNLRSEE